jgi:hypothetical protein
MAQQTAVEWLIDKIAEDYPEIPRAYREECQKAKEMEKDQIGYTEEQAYEIWKAGQEYWKTSGSSITFEELIEKLKNK